MKRLLKKIRNILLSAGQAGVSPKPEDYSVLDNPMEVPRQKESYFFILNKLIKEGDKVLDVGCGLGYGTTIMAIKAGQVSGVDVDQKAIDYCRDFLKKRNPKLKDLKVYDGYNLPYRDKEFDVTVSIDVIEHVEDYDAFTEELLRVTKKAVVFATPNRRPETTNSDGTPANYWHLREWKQNELDEILRKHAAKVEWYFVNGQPDGPYTISKKEEPDSLVLLPVLYPKKKS
ncbi:MAG TPA: class I SAM-dependent methyltransferase [Candidatus Dormibacteraeota bacterium]|nr:class I SAM-dependent methyltransferase [Candidatus Dormibacteraeota bacterium]